MDLSLVPNNDLLNELKKRFPTMVFMGKLYINEKGEWFCLDTSQGDPNLCTGLAMELALKNTYFKLMMQKPTQEF